MPPARHRPPPPPATARRRAAPLSCPSAASRRPGDRGTRGPDAHAFADADPCAELLVRLLQSSSRVDGVAIGRVVEEMGAAEIADDGWPGVDPDAGLSKRDALGAPPLPVFLGEPVQVERAGDGAASMIGLIAGSA